MAAAEEVAGHDAVAVGCARGGAGSAWAAGSAVRAEVGSGDRPGGDAGGGERPQGDLALGSPAAAGSARYAWVTVVPTVWLAACTLTAGLQKIFHPDLRIGFLSHANRYADAAA